MLSHTLDLKDIVEKERAKNKTWTMPALKRIATPWSPIFDIAAYFRKLIGEGPRRVGKSTREQLEPDELLFVRSIRRASDGKFTIGEALDLLEREVETRRTTDKAFVVPAKRLFIKARWNENWDAASWAYLKSKKSDEDLMTHSVPLFTQSEVDRLRRIPMNTRQKKKKCLELARASDFTMGTYPSCTALFLTPKMCRKCGISKMLTFCGPDPPASPPAGPGCSSSRAPTEPSVATVAVAGGAGAGVISPRERLRGDGTGSTSSGSASESRVDSAAAWAPAGTLR